MRLKFLLSLVLVLPLLCGSALARPTHTVAAFTASTQAMTSSSEQILTRPAQLGTQMVLDEASSTKPAADPHAAPSAKPKQSDDSDGDGNTSPILVALSMAATLLGITLWAVHYKLRKERDATERAQYEKNKSGN